jgi:hypothetical protein
VRLRGVDRPYYMRRQLLVGVISLLMPAVILSQQGTPRVGLRQAELEMWTRLEMRARQLGALMLDSSDVDLRFPIQGEPEEVIGVTRLTNSSLAVVTARIEPLEELGARDLPFYSGRYDMRIEDRAGNCILVHTVVSVDSALVKHKRTTEPCQPLYMAEVVRRGRRLARIPLSAGQLSDNWSVAATTVAFADVYLDSVVVMTTKLMLQANLPGPDTSAQIDSVNIGLALGDRSWRIVRKGAPARVDTVLARGGVWSRPRQRFVIPLDSTFALSRSWPVLEVSLSVAKTEANPYGFAWTYAHAPRELFKMLNLSGVP